MKYIFLLISSLMLSMSSYAVDGYKNIKFGSDLEKVMESQICTIKAENVENQNELYYNCEDFRFKDEYVNAFFYFIDKKLERIAFVAGKNRNDYLTLVESLTEKYGPAANNPQTRLNYYMNGTVNSLDLVFDNGTVIARGVPNFDGQSDLIMLIYTSNSFEPKSRALDKKKIIDDI